MNLDNPNFTSLLPTIADNIQDGRRKGKELVPRVIKYMGWTGSIRRVLVLSFPE